MKKCIPSLRSQTWKLLNEVLQRKIQLQKNIFKSPKLVKNEWINYRFVKINTEQSQYWSGTDAEHKQMVGANIKKNCLYCYLILRLKGF